MKLVVDRIEGDLAVLIAADDDQISFSLPLKYLPEGTREGDHLEADFTRDDASRESQRNRIKSLLDRLTSGEERSNN